jgi:hypothetical protein
MAPKPVVESFVCKNIDQSYETREIIWDLSNVAAQHGTRRVYTGARDVAKVVI